MSNNLNISTKPIDVVGIGNAIVDILLQVDDSFLEENSLSKGNMTLINEKQAEELYSSLGPGIESSGGSAANTIAGIAMLGSRTSFIGRVRNDQLGEIFTHDISSTGALFNTPVAKDGPSTARCLIFVTPDAQRTMCTYLGASVNLAPKDLDLSIIKKAKVVYLEGYLWDNSEAKKAFISAAKISKENGSKIALSLSDSFCVDRHRKSFLELISNYVDILFANKSEIISLYQNQNLEDILKNLTSICDIAAITYGEEGSEIIHGSKRIKIKPYKLNKLVDTTGAGDLYAGGFLHGYTKGEDLVTCGKIGSICAGQVVTQFGSRIQTSLKEVIKELL